MAVEVYMPKNGMDMTEGTLIRWLKNEGDSVEKDEPIMEIETDKVTMESESPASGILLKKLYEQGDVVPVLTVMGYIGQPGEKISEHISAPLQETAPADQNSESCTYRVAVIGGGPAGYVAAIRAAQLGAHVVLFEKDTVGGTCLNRGCVPTKTFLKTAEYLQHIRRASTRGIQISGTTTVDMPAVVANKNHVVKTLTGGVAALLRSNGVTVVQGKAELTSAHKIVCEGQEYTAEYIILCGGSKAVRIPIPGIDSPNVLTSTDILDLQEVPKSLCIIGGGVIGCEFASAFQAFGSQVTIVEKMDRLMMTMDADISENLKKSMKKSGIEIYLGDGVCKIEDQNGTIQVTTDHHTISCDKVLLSIGRVSDLDCLGSMADQIKVERGKIVVDDTMKTSVDNIYACGDVNGRAMLAHAAFRMGEVAAENCVEGKNRKCLLNYVPSVLYTIPEASCVGLTEEQAHAKYPDQSIKVGKFPLSANSRAVASGETEGFVKVIIDARFGEILGVHIIGGSASEMIAEPTALMSTEITVQEVVNNLIHAHPSYAEAFDEACKDALNRCIHLPAKKA